MYINIQSFILLSILSKTDAAIWPKTNSEPTGNQHSQSSVHTVPNVYANF
jgi:hypothetical protein